MTNDTVAFISTADEFAELCAACKDLGEPLETLLRYKELRKINVKVRGGSTRASLDHDDAMLVLIEEISVEDCARVLAAGGNMEEIVDLLNTFFAASIPEGDEVRAIADYVDLRCRHSIPEVEAFRRICEDLGIDE